MNVHRIALAALALAAPALAQPDNRPLPFGAVPTPAQVAWHRLEFYGFIHFGANTFTDREWGNGDEDPAIIAPTDLDCVQWAKAAKAAGMKGLILTAKHHDGLCLWPTATTEHNITKTRIRDGKGDLVAELSKACREQGLKFGVYLSPWDRNNANYGKPEYVSTYRAQLRELLAGYGPMFEVWHDGANGGDGYYGGAREKRTIDKLTYYGWPETWSMISSLQPNAIVFSDAGPHCRWVGNESGIAAETSWQTIDNAGRVPGLSYDDLATGKVNSSHWVGVEADVSIRPGWFYHAAEDSKVKTAAELLDIWFKSVGRGSNLILNIPPDRTGRINEIDTANLASLGLILSKTFATNFASGATVAASSDRDNPQSMANKAVDGNPDTYWAAAEGSGVGELTIILREPKLFDVIRIEEAIALGQRVKSFKVSVFKDDGFTPVVEGTTIGPRRIFRLPVPVESKMVKFTITDSLAPPVISEVGLFKLPDLN
ncbi:MAG: alpha-L-fucosidase [Phycisphaerales bacterium]